MGPVISSVAKMRGEYLLHVKTGDKRGAGTDADVWLILHDECGLKTEIVKLNDFFQDNHERHRINSFHITSPAGFHNAEKVEIWRDKDGLADSWFLEYLKAERRKDGTMFWFPINRWILPDRRYCFRVNDCFLPQLDMAMTQRNNELMYKRKLYEYTQHIEGGPVQIKWLPEEEDARYLFNWDISTKDKKFLGYKTLLGLTDGTWEGFGEMLSLYSKEYPEPLVINRWKDDNWFAYQRVQGVNPVSIRLCTELPEGFVTNTIELEKHLDNISLREALTEKRIFVVDHWILKNLPCKDDKTICAPIALFHLNRNLELLPIAIQLFQDMEADNPVFYPSDPPNIWLLAKMYFNSADATYHRACLNIGKTHFLMESIWIAINRQLSPSHPLYKLMAPHFTYLLSVNQMILEKLFVMGGWLDHVTTAGMRGICHLIARWFNGWNFNIDMNPRRELESRGVLDPEVLPYYPYRDDAITVYDIIHRYVTTIVENHYDYPEKVTDDYEIQNWRKELLKDKKCGGCGINGIPGDENGFIKTQQVADTIAGIISTCTIFHAAVNLPQYDELGFVPNYPLSLKGTIPRDKKPISQKELIDQLPTIQATAEIIKALKTLSSETAKPLGYHQSVFLREENDTEAHRLFLEELKHASDAIKKQNGYRKYAYKWLDPEVVPDYIAA